MLKCGWREICKIWEAAWTQSEIGTLILLFPAEMIFNLPDIYFHYIFLYFHVLNLLLFKAKIHLPDIYQTPRNCDFSCFLQKTKKLWYGHSPCYGIRPWYDVSLCFGQLQAVMGRRIELLSKLNICHLFHSIDNKFSEWQSPWCVLGPKRGEKFALPRNIIWWWRREERWSPSWSAVIIELFKCRNFHRGNRDGNNHDESSDKQPSPLGIN